jgi:hypothetical protein
MKKFYAILCLAIVSLTQLQAQAPQGFNYQATVRNSSGDLIVNTNVYFKFNVIQGSQTAVPIFTETHYVPTDDLGQVNLVIGQGTANLGSFSALDWSLGSYYLGIELDTGNGYVAMGTTQLLSVPYALYAENSGNSTPTTPNLEAVLAENNSANNQQIKDLQDPTEAQDAVTKAYIDAQIAEAVAGLQSQIDALQAMTGSDIDNDNDGYTENQGDCDDANAQINPGAEDLIDGIDNNCDGIIDEQRDNISNLLTGAISNDDVGSSKVWYWQSDTDGFLGVGPVDNNGTDSSNPIYWSAPANDSYRSCSYANEFVFTRVSGGVTFEQSGPVYLDNYFDEFGVSETACYSQQVISSIAGVKNVTFLASTSQPALQGTYYNSGTESTFTKASMLFSDNGFMGHYAGHNLAQIEYEIILISENELVVRFVDSDSQLAWYSRFQ